jgi:hypothetical protein
MATGKKAASSAGRIQSNPGSSKRQKKVAVLDLAEKSRERRGGTLR